MFFFSIKQTQLTIFTPIALKGKTVPNHVRVLVVRNDDWTRPLYHVSTESTLKLKHKLMLWLQSLGVEGRHRKGLSFSTVATFFTILMKAALVQSLRSHLLTFVHIRHARTRTHRCMFGSFHRHLSLYSGHTADPECLYLFTTALDCPNPPPPLSPHAARLRKPSHWGVLMKRKYHTGQTTEMSCQASENKPVSDKTQTPAN